MSACYGLANRWLVSMIGLTAFAASAAGAPSARYIVQTLEGETVGSKEITVSTDTHNDRPAMRIDIVERRRSPEAGGDGFDHVRTDRAYLDENGLVYFLRWVEDNGKKTKLEGYPQGDSFYVYLTKPDGGKRSGSALRSSYKTSEYEWDRPGSPFGGMKLKSGRHVRALVPSALGAVRVTRNVNEQRNVDYFGEKHSVLLVNTNVGGEITTAWVDARTGAVLREQTKNFIYLRDPDSLPK